MARTTIDEDITRLEEELSALRVKISNQEALREMEEGGQGSSHRTIFTDIDKLYKRENILEAKLEILYNYKDRY